MSWRSLLVLLDHAPSTRARTACAMRLANALDCHLTGVAPTDLIDLPVTPRAAASLNEYAEQVWGALRAQAEHGADSFRTACRAAGVRSFEAIVDEAAKVESMVRHARCADLAVLTQAEPGAPDFVSTRDLVESVVLHGARPTLVLPYAGRFDTIGERVLVAWNESREAARALSDALPLLQRAASVELAFWSEGATPSAPVRPQLDALQQWLMRHGVSADTRIGSASAGIATTLLSHAADTNADLIVMGAYGHSRWSERVLGGATRGLLESMTVPVLMSH